MQEQSLTYTVLNALTTKELHNYINCTVKQKTGKLKITPAYVGTDRSRV